MTIGTGGTGGDVRHVSLVTQDGMVFLTHYEKALTLQAIAEKADRFLSRVEKTGSQKSYESAQELVLLYDKINVKTTEEDKSSLSQHINEITQKAIAAAQRCTQRLKKRRALARNKTRSKRSK